MTAFAALALAGCGAGAHYDYNHLPSGYRWRAVFDPLSRAVVFYGQDPVTHATVYVGPDSRFYFFYHGGTIEQRDLMNHWLPHDAARI